MGEPAGKQGGRLWEEGGERRQLLSARAVGGEVEQSQDDGVAVAGRLRLAAVDRRGSESGARTTGGGLPRSTADTKPQLVPAANVPHCPSNEVRIPTWAGGDPRGWGTHGAKTQPAAVVAGAVVAHLAVPTVRATPQTA